MSESRGRPSRRRGRGRGRSGGARDGSVTNGNGGGTALETPDGSNGTGQRVAAEGVLELVERGGGFLRRRSASYLPGNGDVFVPQAVIARAKLRPGDEIVGEANPSRNGKGPALERIISIFGRDPADCLERIDFGRLPATHPTSPLRLTLPTPPTRNSDLTAAIVDLMIPLGKGQRALVVAPAKAGKTTLLTTLARGVAANHPDATLYILLADERPEEVTEMEMSVTGEVIASSFDHGAARHVAVAETTLERARRRVELGEDVVIILDSLTRLARAYNNIDKGSGRTLSGGIGAEAMERPKRFFGSARAIDPRHGAGSLTIIATALKDTGSKADEVIFEEFKGTGNAEIVLSRELADRRVFPAIDIAASGTRREELLLDPETLARAHALRQQTAGLPSTKQIEVVKDAIQRG
ncbi:MAG: transcription termination factor Rho [Gemmatimonadales bacterium]|nr:transcription termination factor Rho [Gemmatimonadales bacterium]